MNNWAKIIIGDSGIMKEIKEEAIDLIVTSPPYSEKGKHVLNLLWI